MLLKLVGLIFVFFAFLGVFLPILPTTPFLLLAAGCFAKSSPYLYQKLLNNKLFGPIISNWQVSRSIPKKSKWLALTSMAVAVLWSCYILDNVYLKLLVVALVLWPFIFVARLPLSEENK